MKKNFCFLLFLAIISLSLSAQRFEYQMGLKGALGVGYLGRSDDNITDKTNGFCYKFGFTGVWYFGENYGVTSGFNIIGNDLSYKYKYLDEMKVEHVEKRNLTNTYCQIPILLKMRTDPFSEKYRVFGEIGYGLDLLVNEHDKHNFHHRYRDVSNSFILHLGLEMEVLNRSTLQLMLGWDHFFSNMLSESSDTKMTMSNLCFEVGFLF